VGVLVVVAALAVATWPADHVDTAPAPVAMSAPPGQRPNVIVYLTDDQTTSSMRAEVMPYLFERPFGSWLAFDHFYYSTPACCPSRASIMTGAYAYQVGVIGNTLAHYEDGETLPVWLQRAGYRTGLVGKYLNDPHGVLATYRPPGWSDWHAVAGVTADSDEAENDYYDYVLNENGTLVEHGAADRDYQVDVLTDIAVGFIEETPPNQPFYLQVSPRNPHSTIEPAPRHRALDVPRTGLPPNFDEADVTDKPAWVQALPRVARAPQTAQYTRELRAMRSVDESLHRIIRTLADRGQLDTTVIVVASDNGYSRGSHRVVDKYCPYTECVTGPLWIRYPGVESRSVSEVVSNIDLAPTIGELAGATATIPQDGVSLVPLLDGTATAWRTSALVTWRATTEEVPPYWAVRTPRWSYVVYATGERELYDLAADPYELTNVIGDPAYASAERNLATRLAGLRSRADRRLPSWP
jgi:N-acetylglucosamine-6-sulfatase